MKRKWWITFDAYDIPGGAATILDAAGCGSDVADARDVAVLKQIFVTVKLDDGDERIAKLHKLLKRYGVEVEKFDYIEYSDEDLQSAPLLWMTRDINECVFAGPRLGTKYEMEAACPKCGAGARQTSPLYVEADNLGMIRKHRAISSYYNDIIVDGGIAKKLADAGVTGISFGEVRARLKNKKWSMVAREQILIAHTMPPRGFEPTTSDDKYLCRACRRGGIVHTPLKSYRSEDLIGAQDFNLTWEWSGEFDFNGKVDEALFPRPKVLVTPKVMNIFRDAGVKTFSWTPVFIEE